MIAVEELSIRQGEFALDRVSFTVPAGAYGVLMGRTGGGKTTLLEAIAGIRKPTAGRVLLAGRDVTALLPAARNVGYVPQDAGLFRAMTVWENVAFALTVRRAARSVIESRVSELAERLGIRELLNRRAVGLSGGEAQRVALGRALAFRPPVLLLDEPLNAVDEGTRDQLIEVLRALRRTESVTVLHVTHSRAEAELLGDVHLRFENGRVTAAACETPRGQE